MLQFIINHDVLTLILISFLTMIIGMIIDSKIDRGLGGAIAMLGFFGMASLPLTVWIFTYFIYFTEDNWNRASVYKIITSEQITKIKLPDDTIELWVEKQKIYTINTFQEYLKRDKIIGIESRREVLFGADYNHSKLLFTDGTFTYIYPNLD